MLRSLETLLANALADVHEAACTVNPLPDCADGFFVAYLRLDDASEEESELKDLDLPKKTHVYVNKSLNRIAIVLRKLHFESALLHDRSRMQRQITAMALTNNSASVTDGIERQPSFIAEEAPKDSLAADYGQICVLDQAERACVHLDITILHELLAKVKDRMKIDIQCPLTK